MYEAVQRGYMFASASGSLVGYKAEVRFQLGLTRRKSNALERFFRGPRGATSVEKMGCPSGIGSWNCGRRTRCINCCIIRSASSFNIAACNHSWYFPSETTPSSLLSGSIESSLLRSCAPNLSRCCLSIEPSGGKTTVPMSSSVGTKGSIAKFGPTYSCRNLSPGTATAWILRLEHSSLCKSAKSANFPSVMPSQES